ncbi:hypothetical protein [Spirillospora sp. CA-128828]|uniref:hypothetical protein n=1 Tax=Spirillospora sp. CA-128828 TaxID=3240033 RepID=UPI003D91F225
MQTPGLSHFLSSPPLLLHGWAIALGSAGTFALPAILLTRSPTTGTRPQGT